MADPPIHPLKFESKMKGNPVRYRSVFLQRQIDRRWRLHVQGAAQLVDTAHCVRFRLDQRSHLVLADQIRSIAPDCLCTHHANHPIASTSSLLSSLPVPHTAFRAVRTWTFHTLADDADPALRTRRSMPAPHRSSQRV